MDSNLPNFHRTIFNDYQLQRMEEFYKSNRYPTLNEKCFLANLLQLDRAIVQVWFNNRRAKDKRQGVPIPRKHKTGAQLAREFRNGHAQNYTEYPRYAAEVSTMPRQYPTTYYNEQFDPANNSYYAVPISSNCEYEIVRNQMPFRNEYLVKNGPIPHFLDERSYVAQTYPCQASLQHPVAMTTFREMNHPNYVIQEYIETPSPTIQEAISEFETNASKGVLPDNFEIVSHGQEINESNFTQVESSPELNQPSSSNISTDVPSSPEMESQSDETDEGRASILALRSLIIENFLKAKEFQTSGKRNTIVLQLGQEAPNNPEKESGREVVSKCCNDAAVETESETSAETVIETGNSTENETATETENDTESEFDFEAEFGNQTDFQNNNDELEALFG